MQGTAFNQFYFGTIQEVFPPNHAQNVSKYQYEYQVLITQDDYAQIPVKCVSIDPYGSPYNYLDSILYKNYKVFVLFPKGDRSMGVIMGGGRNYVKPQDPLRGYYFEHRFNEITNTIDRLGAWTVKSDDGPYQIIDKTSITIDDASGESIRLDKTAKTLDINTRELNINVSGNGSSNVNVTVAGNVTIKVSGNANITVVKDVILQANNVTANVKKDATIKAGGIAKVDAKQIELNGSEGRVLSTISDPFSDTIFGELHVGMPTVKSNG